MLAQDAAQAVFMDLARKAGTLTQRTDLTGWLYRSACFAAAKLVRSERRRQVRELEAHRMQEQSSDPQPEPDWDGLRAVLDDVMLELKEPDREALLLRYFRGGSLADVGNKLGLNEQAVAAQLDAGSRPDEEIEAWAQRRDALDRPATRAVQQLLTPGERESFDQLFLGVMGIDLGLGDGAWHRFVRDDGAVVFPSEDPASGTDSTTATP